MMKSSPVPAWIPRCRISWCLAAVTLAVAACSGGMDPDAATKDALAGHIRIGGSPQDKRLLDALQEDFAQRHPSVTFGQALYGPESTLAGVYTGTTDIAFMAREMRLPMERMAFEWVMLDKPLVLDYAEAGLVSERLSTQLGVFVHRDNPLERISLRELDAIYGAEHRRGSANIRSWSDLPAAQGWSGTEIHVYGPEVDSIEALHLRRVVLDDSRKWNPAYRQVEGGENAVIAALSADRAGIAYAPLRAATPAVKLLAVGMDDTPAVRPDEHSVRARSYPLARSLGIVTAHTHAKPMSPLVRAFVAHVLAPEGQAVIAREGGYLPLGEEALRTQRERLP